MSYRHIVNTQDNTRNLWTDRSCAELEPVWQLQLSGSERLECAACGRALEELPEPVSLWSDDGPAAVTHRCIRPLGFDCPAKGPHEEMSA